MKNKPSIKNTLLSVCEPIHQKIIFYTGYLVRSARLTGQMI